MPPKVKYSRQEIIKCAYNIAKEDGIEAVVARRVAKELNTTVSPIFTAFDNMEELKDEVFRVAKAEFIEHLSKCLNYEPAFKQFGILYIEYAYEQPKLYSLLMLGKRELADTYEEIQEEFKDVLIPMKDNIVDTFDVSEIDANDILSQMLFHANGIASLVINKIKPFDTKEIGRYLSETCLGLVAIKKIKNNSFDKEKMSMMAKRVDDDTRRIK